MPAKKKTTKKKPVKKKTVKNKVGRIKKYKQEIVSTDPTIEKIRKTMRKGVWDNAPAFVDGCKFCRKIREDQVIYETDHIAVVLGRQHHKGHLVVATKKHIENMFDLPESALDAYINDTVKIIKALDKVLKPSTVNLEYLDNWDFHVHWNVYPRFKTDPDFGNPPVIPPKGSKFKEYKMTKKELSDFKKEISEIKKMW